jgi:hypothetical protein
MDVMEIVIYSNFTLGWTEFGGKRFAEGGLTQILARLSVGVEYA